MNHLFDILGKFDIHGNVSEIKPLGNGLINDTFFVATRPEESPDYVLQRINHQIFTDVDKLQQNILAVTAHIRKKLADAGEEDIDRKCLRFVALRNSDKTYYFDGENYWRVMVFIPGSRTLEAVNPQSSRAAGEAFGRFQSYLIDLNQPLHETIPDFHNMEFRLSQLRQAVADNPVGRLQEVIPLIEDIDSYAEQMCKAERLHREGKIPRRICHCDTKVNNMLYDDDSDKVLCVIDLDTVMPGFIFSDYGDFLRTGANTGAEDDENLDNVNFDMNIFKAFTEGYISSTRDFLLPVEIENLPYAAALFPYMQAVRFLTDYINGDTYYKISYPSHNLVRTKAQLKLFHSVEAHSAEMADFIGSIL